MSTLQNLTGRRFGRLVVMARAGHRVSPSGARHVRWWCWCDCGRERLVTSNNLRTGNTTSCGCANRDATARRNFKHGHTRRGARTREYRAYRSMLDRCYNPNVESFATYGARGIGVCPAWRESFEAFLADMGRCPSPDLTLDRVDPEIDYEPGNCRWADWTTQANNKLNSRYVMVGEKRLTVAHAAARFNLQPWTLYRRIERGFTVEDVINNRPLPARGALLTLDGVSKTREEWARSVGMHPHTLQTRLWRGWPLREALTPRKGRRRLH